MARIRENSFLEISIHFIKVSFCCHGSRYLVCRKCGQSHKMRIVGRNSKFQPLCCVNSDTILQRNDKRLKKKYGCFMQDSAMAHAVNFLLAALEEIFRKRLMPRRLWPPKFPDLNLCSYYLWRCWKINLCEQSSFFSLTLIQHLVIQHFRNVGPRREVWPFVTSQCMYSFCGYILSYVALTDSIRLL